MTLRILILLLLASASMFAWKARLTQQSNQLPDLSPEQALEQDVRQTTPSNSPVTKSLHKNTQANKPSDIPSALKSFWQGAHGLEFNCKTSNRGAITKDQGTTAFKWVDENGKVHFGDRPPQQTDAESFEFEGELNYFDLTIHDDFASLKPSFRDKLSLGITKSYEVLAAFLPNDILQRVEVNVWIFDQWSDYRSFQKKYAPGLTGRTTGFHNAFFNISAVHAVDERLVLKTSIHESVHVIIGGVFGWIPRWLNEGLAEYLDVMNVFGQAVEIRPKHYWIKHATLLGADKMASFLSIPDKAWGRYSQEDLYAQSWAFTFFLMSENTEKNLVTRYLAEAAKNPCQLLNFKSFAAQHYQGGFDRLLQRYHEWLRNDIVAHQY